MHTAFWRLPCVPRGATAPLARMGAQRRAAWRGLDMARRMGEGRAKRCVKGRGPQAGRLWKAGGAIIIYGNG